MIDFYRPFLTNIFLSRILWVQERNSLAASFTTLLPTLFSDQNRLTQSEEPVALQVLLGKSDPEIAEAMNLQVSTVRSHVQKILKKSGFDSRRRFMGSVLTRDMQTPDHSPDSPPDP